MLTNPKHERFAQELAKGTSQSHAYQTAGFKPNRHNAATLARKQHILDRVSELLAERESIHAQATADAVKSTSLTKEWVIETLVENVARAMQAKPVRTDDDGGAVGEYQYQGNVANKALELLGKELGMFIERKEVGKPGEFDNMTVEQKRERVIGIAKQLGLDRIGPTAGTA